MADSVTVEQGGLTVTTNTASEADLRAELTRDDASLKETPESLKETPADTPAGPDRDPKGRFAKRDAGPAAAPSAGAPSEPPPDPAAETAAEKAARDPSLPKHNPVTRMKEALAQKLEAERRAAVLEAELQRLRGSVTSSVTPTGSGGHLVEPPPMGQPGAIPRPPSPFAGDQRPPASGEEPQFEQFAQQADPYTAYVQAWARWDNARQIEARFAAYEQQLAAQAQQRSFEQRIAEGAQQHPDWQEALTQADTLGLQVSAVMQAAIITSPHAADLVHYLATHPEECTQLAEESVTTPVAAATVMRRLLESHLAPRPVPSNGTGTGARAPVSTAKPPVKPVGSSPVGSDAPPGEEASAAEHARYWNRKLKVPGTR